MRGRPRKFRSKNSYHSPENIQDNMTVVERNRRALVGDNWREKDAGNVIGLLFLSGYLTEEERDQAYYLSYLKETYSKTVGSPMLSQRFLCKERGRKQFTEEEKERFCKFIERKYLDYLQCLRQGGKHVFLHTFRALDNETSDVRYVKEGLSLLVSYFKKIQSIHR